jgi:phospholipid-binding lipoprotein MlaA
LKPIAVTYSKSPTPIKYGITNFFRNLKEVDNTVNQLLQGKPKSAANDLGRFVINSTIGLGGLIDVASNMGLERHDEDFGQTLGVWGIPSGPYIMIPMLGPSSTRDLLSRPISSFLGGTFHMDDNNVRISLTALDAIETRERLLDVESLLSGDKYDFVRDSYSQSREYEIKDGIGIEDDFIDDMDDFLID